MKSIYEQPNIVLTLLEENDIVRTSPGDGFEEDDFPAFKGA